MDLKEALAIREDPKEWAKEYRDRYLKCPFCFERILDFRKIDTPFGDTHDGGSCANCGAVYIYDRTGRLLGEAFMETIAMAYDWDYDKALEGADGGYEEAIVRYESKSARYFLGDEGRLGRSAKYCFIRRLRQD